MPITISYTRVPGYPKERLTKTEIESVDLLLCAWDDRITLAKELLGFAVGGTLQSPHEYDFGDEPISNIFCKDVSIEPLMGVNDSGDYIKAQLTVVYGNLDYTAPDTGEVVYITESLEPASEYLTLDSEKLWWSDDKALNAGEAPAMILRMVDWVYTIHFVSYIPSWVWTHPGTINNAAIYSRELNKVFGTETLLCGNPSLSREVTSEGTTAWTISVRFTYRPAGWNRFPRPDATVSTIMQFENIYKAKGGAAADIVRPYPVANFGNIVL